MFPGRSAKSKQAAQSHTGALVGDYATMRTQVEDAGAIVVTTMDEMMDLAEILVRYPKPPAKGPGILTASGAFVGLSNDMAEDLGLEFPEIEPATLKIFNEMLPPYGNYGNPLDVTAGFTPTRCRGGQGAARRSEHRHAVHLVSDQHRDPGAGLQQGHGDSDKPKVMVALGDTWTLGPDVIEAVKQSPAVFGRSSDRMMRAVALYTRYGRLLARLPAASPSRSRACQARQGRAAGMARQEAVRGGRHPVPAGPRPHRGRGRRVASAIGFPVVLKAQAAALSHKTEAGGVMLNLADEAELRAAWETLTTNVKRAAPGVTLDGALVEKMSPKGIELMVGAKRDPGWGTVLLLGLGGIWVEALGDVQLLPGDADEAQIVEALGKLRSAKLLAGVRGAPPADIDAVARRHGHRPTDADRYRSSSRSTSIR